MKKLSIIIPAYNESKTIRRLIEKIWVVSFPCDYEILVIDDYSRDRTYRIAKILQQNDLDKRIRLFRNDANHGKGYCIRRGLENASGDIIVVQDADFEYDPSDIPKLMGPVLSGETAAVFGSRFLGKGVPEGMAFPNFIANRFLSLLTNLLYGCRVTDMETCYKVVSKDVALGLNLRAHRFDFEPEITTKLVKAGVHIKELPISYRGRTAGEGKKIKARDFFIAIWVLFRNRF